MEYVILQKVNESPNKRKCTTFHNKHPICIKIMLQNLSSSSVAIYHKPSWAKIKGCLLEDDGCLFSFNWWLKGTNIQYIWSLFVKLNILRLISDWLSYLYELVSELLFVTNYISNKPGDHIKRTSSLLLKSNIFTQLTSFWWLWGILGSYN